MGVSKGMRGQVEGDPSKWAVRVDWVKPPMPINLLMRAGLTVGVLDVHLDGLGRMWVSR